MMQIENLKNYMEKIMKNNVQKSSFLLMPFLILISFSAVNAKSRGDHVAKEKIGQEFYLKRCSSCHGEGKRGGNINSKQEWEEIFAKNGADLVELHEYEDNTENIIKYIKSNEFKKESKRMLKFLQEFAYDSEYIPTCY